MNKACFEYNSFYTNCISLFINRLICCSHLHSMNTFKYIFGAGRKVRKIFDDRSIIQSKGISIVNINLAKISKYDKFRGIKN